MEREDRECYEILELGAGASPADVRKAYLFLKELYSTESIVTIPLEDELPPEAQRQIIDEIEEAYRRLAAEAERQPDPVREKRQPPAIDPEAVFTGPLLRQIREQLAIELQDLALATHIQVQYLEDIEDENFAALPVYVYTRGYVANYAKHLGLDAQKVTADYMGRFAAAQPDD